MDNNINFNIISSSKILKISFIKNITIAANIPNTVDTTDAIKAANIDISAENVKNSEIVLEFNTLNPLYDKAIIIKNMITENTYLI